MIVAARKTLIRVGKMLPFVVCFLVCINYIDSLCSVLFDDYIQYGNINIPNTRLSFFIGQYFEYNIQMLFVLVILSIAIETCVYNKLACAYLGFNLLEKSYLDFELEPTTIYIICIINIVITSFLCYKGVKQLMK